MTTPAPPPLYYAPAPPPWHQRKHVRRAIVLSVLLAAAGLAYHYRHHLLYEWRRILVVRARYNCLYDSPSPDTVVYEEDRAAARQLIDRHGYDPLPCNAAGRPWDRLDALVAAMDNLRGLKVAPNVIMPPGALVFMHERHNPVGQRYLVVATYAARDESTHGGFLTVYLFDVDSARPAPHGVVCQFAGGRPGIRDTQILPPVDASLADGRPQTNKLRIFAGQPDPADPTRFTFDYELAGRRGRAAVRLLDPDPTAPRPATRTWSRIDIAPVSLSRSTRPSTP